MRRRNKEDEPRKKGSWRRMEGHNSCDGCLVFMALESEFWCIIGGRFASYLCDVAS